MEQPLSPLEQYAAEAQIKTDEQLAEQSKEKNISIFESKDTKEGEELTPPPPEKLKDLNLIETEGTPVEPSKSSERAYLEGSKLLVKVLEVALKYGVPFAYEKMNDVSLNLTKAEKNKMNFDNAEKKELTEAVKDVLADYGIMEDASPLFRLTVIVIGLTMNKFDDLENIHSLKKKDETIKELNEKAKNQEREIEELRKQLKKAEVVKKEVEPKKETATATATESKPIPKKRGPKPKTDKAE